MKPPLLPTDDELTEIIRRIFKTDKNLKRNRDNVIDYVKFCVGQRKQQEFVQRQHQQQQP